MTTSIPTQLRSRAEVLAKRVIRRRILSGHYRSTRVHYGTGTGTGATGTAAGAGATGTAAAAHPVPVFMCLWNRPTRLIDMLEALDGQTGTPGITFHIWNNNKADHDHYLEVVRNFRPRGALREVQLVKTPYNLGSMGRFHLARDHARAHGAGPAIVVDDDENLQADFVSTALAAYAPGTVSAWWAFEVGRNYYDRRPAVVGGPVDHVGPGGMITDSAIFLDDGFFTELPEKYFFVDDLWFTYYAARRRGMTLKKLGVDIEFVMDETNQSYGLVDLKLALFEELYPERATMPPQFEFPEG